MSNQYWYKGDFNYDGTVNILDFNLLAQNYNTSLMSSIGASGARR